MEHKPDIILLTEIYLHSGIGDNEIDLHGYSILRKDRHDFSNAPIGGSVLIAIKTELNCIKLNTTCVDCVLHS